MPVKTAKERRKYFATADADLPVISDYGAFVFLQET